MPTTGGRTPTTRRGAGRPLVLGHRGASADAPENTLAAFALAMEQGADGVELDVWRCASGEVVVHHDADTQRTAGQRLRVGRATLSQLRRLDVGAWKGVRWAGERIATLREVLETFPAAVVNVELKSDRWPDPGLAAAVARDLAEAGAAGRCVVSSFDPLLLAAFRLAAPRVASGVLFAAGRGWRAREQLGTRLLRVAAVHPQAAIVTERRARAWARRGLRVHVWTVDDPVEVARLAAAGVDAVITNAPARARAALEGAAGT